MKILMEVRLPGSSSWITNLAEKYTFADVWEALYYGPRSKEDIALPERVRIGYEHGGNVQRVFEGSYPAALMWTLGIWNTPAKIRLPLEKQLKEALCLTGGDCQEEDDEKGDSVESTEG